MKNIIKWSFFHILLAIFIYMSILTPWLELKPYIEQANNGRFRGIHPIVLSYTLYNNLVSSQAFADSFLNTVREGKNLGTDLRRSYIPKETLDKTLTDKGLDPEQKITPRIDEAQQERSSLEQYYTNPDSMSTAPIDQELKDFVDQSHGQGYSVGIGLEPEGTFGNKCLQRNPDGSCGAWSLSDQVLYENFPDCEKVVTPRYGEEECHTCTERITYQKTDICEISHDISITQQWYSVPCSSVPNEFQPGQIYAVCKDYYTWYRVSGGSNAKHNTPVDFQVVSSPPPGAFFVFSGSNDERYRYQWYAQYNGSLVERLILTSRNSCGLNLQDMTQNCTVEYLEMCDRAMNNCIVVVENGEPTGLLPELDYLVKIPVGTSTTVCDECKDKCYEGVCPTNAVAKTSIPPGMTLVGKFRKLTSENCDSDEGGCYYQEWFYYKDTRVCEEWAGSLENYLICLKGETLWIDNGTGLTQATNPATRVNGSCREVDALTITYFYLYGSPYILNNGYVWHGRIKFSCSQQSSDCQQWVDKGCHYKEHRCLDSSCDQLEYTYCCGQSGITGYEVKYTCPGDIRCIGTECQDMSYEANDDFGKMATAFEILNQYRADSDGIRIFPGSESKCQSSPKSCCKNPGVGVSIGDYVKAARAAISAYKLLSGGLPATWNSFAIAFTNVLSGNTFTGLAQLLGVKSTSGVIVMQLTEASPIAANAIGAGFWTTVDGAGNTIVILEVAPNSIVGTLSTVMTVVTVALTVYTIVKFIYDIIFACTKEDIITSYKVGLRLCHYVGEYCDTDVLGWCIKKKKSYCCFNSILARLVHECVRPQVGRHWGDAESPDCRGLLPGELASADLSKCDFSEYMRHVEHKTELTAEDILRIKENISNKLPQ